MKFLQYLLLAAITLLGTNQIFAQTSVRAYFEYVKGVKCVNIDGTTYKPISPSIFVAKGDTIEKFQHPLRGKPAIQREGYTLIAIIWEPLAFKNSECTSKQIVDLYRKKKMTPKDAPKTEIEFITITKDSIVWEYCYIDTGRVVYKMPVDTGGLWVTLYPDVEIEKYINSNKKPHGAFKVGVEAVLWNGEKAPVVIVVPKMPDSTKVDPTKTLAKKDSLQTAANVKVDDPTLLRNLRIVALNEVGIERAHTGYFVSEDTCFICLDEQKLYRLVGEVAVGAQIAPRRPLNDEQFQVSVMFEARYRYLGEVTQVPNSNGWNRLSLGVAARAEYGPFVFQVRPKWTPGLGVGWTAGINYNIVKWAPKKKGKAKQKSLPTVKL